MEAHTEKLHAMFNKDLEELKNSGEQYSNWKWKQRESIAQ